MFTTDEINRLFTTGYCKGQGTCVSVLKCWAEAGRVICSDNKVKFTLGCASVAVGTGGVSASFTSEL